MKKHKANLFIVGTMKAGTTSFIDALSLHPQIYLPPIKEPHFFIDQLPGSFYEPSRFFNLEKYFENEFPNLLHITKIETQSQYDTLFSLAKKNQTYRCDGSTCYLQAPESAQLIYKYNPNAKIIIIQRDTIKRAFSHYSMDVALSRELRGFNTIISSEIEGYHKNKLPWHSYLGMGLYKNSVARYKRLFKENVLILNFETLINKPQETLKLVFDFLEIPPLENVPLKHKNEGKSLKFKKLFYILKKLGVKDYFSRIFGYHFKQKIFKLASRKRNTKIELTSKIKKELEVILKNEN